MEWLGSVAMDGYQWDEVPDNPIRRAQTVDQFRNAVADELARISHSTLPSDGWPWPWTDSRTTDYAYVFDVSGLRVFVFGREGETEEKWDGFPDMRDVQNVQYGHKSGVLILQRS